MMASVSGRRSVTSVPGPGSGGDVDGAAQRLDGPLDHVHADAAAGERRDLAGGREAGAGTGTGTGRRRRAAAPAASSPCSSALARMRSRSRPRAVVGDGDQNLGAGVAGDQADPPFGRLAGGGALGGGLQAMVDGVADQVDQRIGEPLDHGLVELGLLALHGQIDLLAEIAREVVDQPAEAAEQRADRDHADAHGGVAQGGGEPLDLLGDRLDLQVGAGGGELAQPGLGDDQLADPVHQLVEALGRHPQAGGLGLVGLAPAGSVAPVAAA